MNPLERSSVKLPSRTGNRARISTIIRQICGYAAAVSLPWMTAHLSSSIEALHRTPLALSFACLAAITLLSGIGPGVVATVCATLAFNYYVLAPEQFWSIAVPDIRRTMVVFAVGLFVNWLCHRQRVIGDRLRLALESLQSRTDALMEAQQGSNSVAWTFNVSDRTVRWAEGGAEIFGRPFSALDCHTSSFDMILEEDRARIEETLDRAIAVGHPFRGEFRVRWPNGELHWLESRGTPLPHNSGLWRGVAIDITDRKNAEFALIRSEKLAAIGRLSATIAHEINNPLEAVTNLIYLAALDPELQPATRDLLDQADRELARLASIARHTLTFVRPKSSNGPVRVSEVAESVVAIFRPRSASCGGVIRLHCGADPYVDVSSDDLRQILTNILSNACDALTARNGLIEVEIAARGALARIDIRDNGAGIAREHLGSIFDPFFTTKENVGTGIGLWVSRELAEKSGGRISVHVDGLAPGFQTMFSIEFPAVTLPSA